MSRLLEGFKALKTGGINGVFVIKKKIHPGSKEKEDPTFVTQKAKELCGLMVKDVLYIVDSN